MRFDMSKHQFGWDRYKGSGTTYDGHKPRPQKIGEYIDMEKPIIKHNEDRVIERILDTPLSIWHKNNEQEFYAYWGTGQYSITIKIEVTSVVLEVSRVGRPSPFYKLDLCYGTIGFDQLVAYLKEVLAYMEGLRQHTQDEFFKWLKQGEE